MSEIMIILVKEKMAEIIIVLRIIVQMYEIVIQLIIM